MNTSNKQEFIKELEELLEKYNLEMTGTYEEYVLFKERNSEKEFCSYLEGDWYC